MYSLGYLLNRFYHKCQLGLSNAQILLHVYSLDYRLHIFYHKCTAYIIYSTDFITNVKFGLSTQDICITNAQLRLSTQEILSQMYSLDYLLDRFYYKCTALIIDSTNFITHVHLGLSTQQILFQM